MRRFFSTTETLLRYPAAHAQMKVVIVRIGARRLMKNPGGSNDCLRRALIARGIAQKPGLQLVRAEEPFHPGFVVHDETANQVPVSRVVEAEQSLSDDREPKAIEAQPATAKHGQAANISHEKQKVGVPAGTMGAMPPM